MFFLWNKQGLSPDLQTMEQIRRIMRPTDVPDTGTVLLFCFLLLIKFSSCLGLLCDLLWWVLKGCRFNWLFRDENRSDPDKETQGWGENDRGVSFTFGADVVAKVSFLLNS